MCEKNGNESAGGGGGGGVPAGTGARISRFCVFGEEGAEDDDEFNFVDKER